MPNMFRAARYPLKQWDKDGAGIDDVAKVGLKGSPTVVSKVFAPTPRSQKAEIIQTESGQPKDIAVTLLAKLFTRHPNLRKEIGRGAL
jgi:electron transfer flavoprotein beta subunit